MEEMTKRAEEASVEATKAEENVKRMEAVAGKCCGCIDHKCSASKNIKKTIKAF